MNPAFLRLTEGPCHVDIRQKNQPWVSAHGHPRMQLPQEGCLQDASSARTLTASLWAVSAQDEPPKGLGVSVSTGGRNADSPEDPNLLRGVRGGRVERGARPSVPWPPQSPLYPLRPLRPALFSTRPEPSVPWTRPPPAPLCPGPRPHPAVAARPRQHSQNSTSRYL